MIRPWVRGCSGSAAQRWHSGGWLLDDVLSDFRIPDHREAEIMIGDEIFVTLCRFSFFHLQVQSNTDLLCLAFSLDTWFRRSRYLRDHRALRRIWWNGHRRGFPTQPGQTVSQRRQQPAGYQPLAQQHVLKVNLNHLDAARLIH